MELILDRKLAARRIYPALDIKRSGTRKEDMLLSAEELSVVWQFRKTFSTTDNAEAAEMMLDGMKKTPNNKVLCNVMKKLEDK